MPIHEFKCGKCGESFEWLQLSSREQPACPKCGSKEAERQLSVFAVGAPSRAKPALSCACGEDGVCPAGTPPPGCAGCAHG